MRIGLLTAYYKPVINGVTRMVALYKRHLEARGHDVTIFTLGEPDPAGEEPGVVRSPAMALGEGGYYVSLRYSDRVQAQLRQMDILHGHHLFMGLDMAHRYGRCPIVYTNHTRYDLYTSVYTSLPQPTATALMRRIWPEYVNLADLVIAPSAQVRELLLAFGVRQPIEVVANGINLPPFWQPTAPFCKADFGLAESDVLLMYVGRLAAEKNLPALLAQFAMAHRSVPQLRLMLVGQGALLAQLQNQAQQLGIGQQVQFAGAVPYDEVPNYLATADLFVTASVSEVHPLTVIEAMAAGLPVTAVASPGIVELIEPTVSGLLTSESGLAAAMVELALDADKRQRLGAAARAASHRFAIEKTVAQTEILYERLQATRPDLQRQRPHGRWLRPRK